MQLQQDMLFDNRYLLKRILGSGGFSEIWLVEDTRVANKKMALKVYAPEKGLDEDGVRLFSDEFEMVFDLNHTHLLRPSHFDIYERSPYLLMPYFEQGSTDKLAGNITEDVAWRFLHDVSSGLTYLHDQDPPIVHQDIKPDNVLIDNKGNFLITDFGISTKARSTLRKSVSSAKAGGTLAYMPPERFGKENAPIMASDIWAMGATVYELLTGSVPFGEHGGVIQKSGAEIPNVFGGWSNEIQEILNRCLQKDPWNRPVAKQILEWTEKHFRGERIIFNTSKQSKDLTRQKSGFPLKKIGLIIAACILVAILVFVVKNFIDTKDEGTLFAKKVETLTKNENNPETIEEDSPKNDSILNPIPAAYKELEVDKVSQDAQNSKVEPKSKEPDTTQPEIITKEPVTTQPEKPAWVADYDKAISRAKSAFKSNNYKTSIEEYNKALDLAKRNGDGNKVIFVEKNIEECDMAIYKAEEAAKAKEIAKQDRLDKYNCVGLESFKLGSYMVVQEISTQKWGIIDADGYPKVLFIYERASRLKDNLYKFGLRTKEGWDIFDTSLNKKYVEKLDDYIK